MTEEIRQDWLERAKMHREADRFIQGAWLNGLVGDYKSGCFFGCMTQKEDGVLDTAAKEMDVPLWLVHVAERIFEGLPKDEAVEFPVQFLEAINPNRDLTEFYNQFFFQLLMDKERGQIMFLDKDSEESKAIEQVAELFRTGD